MAQKGLYSTLDVESRSVKQGFEGALMYYEMANMAPLIAMMGAKSNRNYNDIRIEWSEAQHITGVNGIIDYHNDPKGCVLSFADTSWVTENTLFLVIRTGEIIFVHSVDGNVVTVERGFGDTDCLPINVNASTDEVIQRIGTAFPEGSERPDPISFYNISKVNYNQIFRNTWAVTRTAAMLKYTDGDLMKKLKQESLMMHMRDIEMTLLFGVKSLSYQDQRPLRTMDGLYRQLCTNIGCPYDGVLTVPMLDNFIERVMEHNIKGKPQRHIAFCGRGFLTLINRMARLSQQYQVDGTQDFFGQVINTWRTPHGTIRLMVHDLLSEIPGYRNDFILLHQDTVELYYMYEGKEEHMGIQGNDGVDAHIGGYITEMTMKVNMELASGYMTGVCDVAGESQPFYLVNPHESTPNPGC